MLVTGLVQIFLPFNKTTDLVIACFGVLLFSGYSKRTRSLHVFLANLCLAVYDTHAIMKRLSPDEYILGALSLYLVRNCLRCVFPFHSLLTLFIGKDFINLFLYILRVVNASLRASERRY